MEEVSDGARDDEGAEAAYEAHGEHYDAVASGVGIRAGRYGPDADGPR